MGGSAKNTEEADIKEQDGSARHLTEAHSDRAVLAGDKKCFCASRVRTASMKATSHGAYFFRTHYVRSTVALRQFPASHYVTYLTDVCVGTGVCRIPQRGMPERTKTLIERT